MIDGMYTFTVALHWNEQEVGFRGAIHESEETVIFSGHQSPTYALVY